MKVLIADDDRVTLRLLEKTVTKLGHEVTAVADGHAALAALSEDEGPRLALLDWMMPGIDGVDVCRAIRRRTQHYVYIILVTARDRREDMLAGLEAESDDFVAKPIDVLELRARLRSGERVLTLQRDLLQTQQALRFEATHDALTGLWNRRAILERLAEEARRTTTERRPLAIGLIDIDDFKEFNDSQGHLMGDEVLRELARRMGGIVREYEPVGRYGGEEFLMVLPGSDGAQAVQALDRLRREVADEPILTEEGVLRFTVSAGVAWARDAVGRTQDLIQLADAALYRAKRRGRNRVEQATISLEPLTAATGGLLKRHSDRSGSPPHDA